MAALQKQFQCHWRTARCFLLVTWNKWWHPSNLKKWRHIINECYLEFLMSYFPPKIIFVCTSYNIPVAKKKYAIFIGTIPQFICLDIAATQSVRGIEPLASLFFAIFYCRCFWVLAEIKIISQAWLIAWYFFHQRLG